MNKIDARKLSPDALKALRIQALRMRETLNLPWRQIAHVMGVHVTTVLAWAQRYASEGEVGLQSKRPGRAYMSGRTLREEQEWLLRTVLTSEAPSARGLNFALWNRRAVVQLVQQLFGIEMPIRTVGQYLQRWGYTPQRPSRRALEQKPLDVERWLKEIYPVIAHRAKQESAIIYWMDETAVAQDGHWARGYAPAGQTPVLNAISQRFGLTMVSAVSNQGRVCFEFLEGAANTHSTLDFMQKLVTDSAGQKVFLIMDNLKVHHAKDVTAWAQAHAREIELFYLPPYTPQLNPDEHLNRDFKTALRSVSGCSSRTGLLAQAQEFMQSLVNMPERVKSYFRHGEVVFAA